jgi:hypothetical protein
VSVTAHGEHVVHAIDLVGIASPGCVPKPIDVWRQSNVVVDGHTRRLAAIDASSQVVVCYHDFANEDEALDYAIANQRDRRNLDDGELLRLLEVRDKRKQRGAHVGNQYTGVEKTSSEVISKSSSVATAELVGASRTKVEKARAIIPRDGGRQEEGEGRRQEERSGEINWVK